MMADYQWEGFFRLANTIMNSTSQNETVYRTATSRAYYATYHQAHRFACSRDSAINSSYIKHEQLIKWFRHQTTDPQLMYIGLALDALKRSRIHADYEPHVFIKSKAEHDILQANDIIEAIKQIQQGSTATTP